MSWREDGMGQGGGRLDQLQDGGPLPRPDSASLGPWGPSSVISLVLE